jgi:FkbM family methyltransferase
MELNLIMTNDLTNENAMDIARDLAYGASIQEARCIAWFSARGDENLRLNYELSENSIVFDLGGYKGEWSSKIFSRYQCQIHIFEPVQEFADIIKKRFAHNDKVVLHRFGLGCETKRANICISSDASSLFKGDGELEEISLVKGIDFIKDNNIGKVDLMKINIEGAEYDLIEHLIDANFIRNIMNLQVQFHDVVPGAVERSAKLREVLQKTHYLTYQYEFVWENWRRREIPETVRECNKKAVELYEEIDFHSNELLASRRENVALRLKVQNIEAQLRETQSELQTKLIDMEAELQAKIHEMQADLLRIKKSVSFRLGYFVLHPWRIMQVVIAKFRW